MSYFIKWN